VARPPCGKCRPARGAEPLSPPSSARAGPQRQLGVDQAQQVAWSHERGSW
jgi:hypothetical protein